MENLDELTLEEFVRKTTVKNPKVEVLKTREDGDYNALVQLIEQVFQSESNRGTLLLPELRKYTNTVAVFSDYGGESNDSKYKTYSFLVCDYQAAKAIIKEKMIDIRKQFNLKNKEISYKDLSFGPISRSITSYLNAINTGVVGFLYTVIIEKEIKTVFGDINKRISQDYVDLIKSNGLGSRKPEVCEKVLRITHIASYLIGLFAKEGQKIFWMTDDDSIAPNDTKTKDTLNLFCSILPLYAPYKFEVIAGATPFKEKNIEHLDLLSITDLVAGALEGLFSNTEEQGLKEGVEKIINWLGYDGMLKKRTTMIRRVENNKIIASNIVFNAEALGNAQIIYI